MKPRSCFLIILIIFFALLGFGLWSYSNILTQAQANFGPASPTLSFSQRFLLSWRLLQAQENLTTPANLYGSQMPFQIELGETPDSVAKRLEAQGLIHDSGDFRNFLVYAGIDTQVQAGNYVLSPAKPAVEIALNLLDATPKQVPFVVLAGWRLDEIAASLPSSGLQISPDIFIQKATNRDLEGRLLPGTYILDREITVNEMLDTLNAAFEQSLSSEMMAGFNAQGLTVEQALRLASIVEREAVDDREKPIIASVFLNRLSVGMKLEADPTVQYALGFNQVQATWWTNPLSAADLQVDSPYNTYRYPGLPPGPICNPSLASLKAVSIPAQTPYYYFRATCDDRGRHNFAETYQEHLDNQCP
jgi:UPF0755 protein